jgi:hypothetical protein
VRERVVPQLVAGSYEAMRGSRSLDHVRACHEERGPHAARRQHAEYVADHRLDRPVVERQSHHALGRLHPWHHFPKDLVRPGARQTVQSVHGREQETCPTDENHEPTTPQDLHAETPFAPDDSTLGRQRCTRRATFEALRNEGANAQGSVSLPTRSRAS